MPSVVITGADGFLGSHLCKCFSNYNYDVYAIVIPNSPTLFRIKDVQNIRIIEVSIENALNRIGEFPNNPEALIHLAWAGVSPENRNSTEYQINNISLGIASVKLANKIHAKKFIMPGSTMEYSFGEGLISSNSLPTPQNAYGFVKVSAKYICESLCKEYDIPFIYAVISSIYAADRTDNNVVTYTIRELLNGNKPILTELKQKWDYVYITDVEQAFYCIVEKGKANSTYVIGHGDNQSLANYIYKIRDLIDPKLPLGIGEKSYEEGVIPNSCVDINKLRNETGFEPIVSFEEGITKVITAMRESLENE